jgi:hypothetical protein
VEGPAASCTSQLLLSQDNAGFSTVRGRVYSTLVAVLIGAECVGSPANEAPDSLRVALLTPGPIPDQVSSGEAYRGLVAVWGKK